MNENIMEPNNFDPDLKMYYDYIDALHKEGQGESVEHVLRISSHVFLSRWQRLKLGWSIMVGIIFW